jgi:hypothetical protein
MTFGMGMGKTERASSLMVIFMAYGHAELRKQLGKFPGNKHDLVLETLMHREELRNEHTSKELLW